MKNDNVNCEKSKRERIKVKRRVPLIPGGGKPKGGYKYEGCGLSFLETIFYIFSRRS